MKFKEYEMPDGRKAVFDYDDNGVGRITLECMDMLMDMITSSMWIPCSERLPKYRELVIITTRDLRVRLAYLDSIYDNHTDDLWDMPLDNAECALWNVVAWMPLPEPWKGADDETRNETV